LPISKFPEITTRWGTKTSIRGDTWPPEHVLGEPLVSDHPKLGPGSTARAAHRGRAKRWTEKSSTIQFVVR